MASLGLQRNLVTYFVNKMNIHKLAAANMVSNFVGALYLTPFLGGFLADAYLGHLCFCNHSSPWHGRLDALCIITLSTAYIMQFPQTTCTSAHDQFDEHDPKEWKYVPFFFNWFYFIISIGSLISVTVFVYIQDDIQLPSGSPLTRILQVIVRKQNLPLPLNKETFFEEEIVDSGYTTVKKLPHSNQFKFLDKAAIVSREEGKAGVSKWYLPMPSHSSGGGENVD
ncbi:hypothetical protein L7F22_020999 [Adiantum nelumboides]|nr:hypothetical protein [Adiantum nelumboides]